MEVVTKKSLGRLVAVEAAEEIPYRTGTNVVANGIALGLNINAIKPKSVLVNHAINSVVAAAAKGAASIGNGTAKSHAQKQIDDKALKKIRRRAADTVKQFLRKGSVYLTMRRAHCFVGRLRLVRKFGRCRGLIVRRLLGCSPPKFLKLFKLAEKIVVDAGGFRRHDLLPARRDFEIAAPRSFDQSGLAEIGFSPMHSIGEKCLRTRGQELRTFFRR